MSSGWNLQLKNFVLQHFFCPLLYYCVVTCVMCVFCYMCIFWGRGWGLPRLQMFCNTHLPHPFSTLYLNSRVLTLSIPRRGLSLNTGILNTNTCIVRRSRQPSDLTFTADPVGTYSVLVWIYRLIDIICENVAFVLIICEHLCDLYLRLWAMNEKTQNREQLCLKKAQLLDIKIER